MIHSNILSDLLRQAQLTSRTSTPVVIQTEAAECGLACLTMIAGHYGYETDLPAMRRRFTTSLQGMTLRDLTVLSGMLSLATRALRVDLSAISKVRLPCILHWDHTHFVVLTQVERDRFTIHDPAVGRRRLSLAEISKHFTGVVLEAWPTDRFERKKERQTISLLSLIARTRGLGRAAAQVLALSIVLEVVTIAMPIAFQVVVDQVVVAADYDLLTLVAIALFLMLAIKVVAAFFRSWATMMFGSSLVVQWKVSLFDHLIRLPLSFFEKRHVGDIVSRFSSLDQIQETATTKSVTAVLDGIMAIALVLMMYLYGGWLVILAIGSMVLYALLRAGTYRFYRSLSEDALLQEANENSHFMESVRGMASLKALNLEQTRRAVWVGHLISRVGARLRIEKFNVTFAAASQSLFGVDRIIMIYFGGSAVLDGNLSVGMLIAFMAYKDQFAERINGFIDTAIAMRVLSLHGDRIADIAVSDQEDVASGALAVPAIASSDGNPGSLVLDRIGFRYSDNQPEILKSISLQIGPGECVAIAGPSGAGKSTLLKIMAGLIVPTDGRILIDGVEAGALGYANYRGRVGCVLQEDRLFAGSIAENIAGFRPLMNPAVIQACAKMTAVHEEIMRMPMGYETLVGDMGSALSGGQRQRIILARALYRRPSILFLDEATSHLDPENEARINKALQALPITRVIVAHRPSSLAVADRLVEISRPL
jgi:ATP-binding cassette subfamily B protein RaxB